MPKATKISTFLQSTRTPTLSAESLTQWWDRPLPTNLPYGGYLAFKVRVHSKGVGNEGRVLEFFVVGHEAPDNKPFSLKLDLEHGYVWPDLPSTAPMGDAGQFGFLFLTPQWLAQNGVPESLAEDGGKWPIGAGLAPALVLQLFEALKDEGLREKVQRLMVAYFPSKG